MSGVNNFPDGVANDGRIIVFPNPKAPEENYPEQHGEDLTWVAGVGGAHGYQPITSTNQNGDYAVSLRNGSGSDSKGLEGAPHRITRGSAVNVSASLSGAFKAPENGEAPEPCGSGASLRLAGVYTASDCVAGHVRTSSGSPVSLIVILTASASNPSPRRVVVQILTSTS
jgi:hypothetical protein